MAENLTIRVDAETSTASRALKGLGGDLGDLDDEMKALISETRKLDKSFEGVDKSADKAGSSFGGLAKNAAAITGGLLLAVGAAKAVAGALKVLGGGAIKTGSELELLENRLATIMGSSEEAKIRFDELFAEASQSPFDVTSLVEADVTLQAFGHNSRELLGPLQDVAAVMGEDLPASAVWMAKAFSQGASGMEGDTAKMVRQMVEMRTGINATEMSLEDFQEALLETLTDPNGKFAGGAKKLVSTWQGAVSNMSDEWTRFTKEIADAGLFEGAKLTLRAVLDSIDDNRAAVNSLAKTISDVLLDSLLGVLKMSGFILDTFNAVRATMLEFKFSDAAQEYEELAEAHNKMLGTEDFTEEAFQVASRGVKAAWSRVEAVETEINAVRDMIGFYGEASAIAGEIKAKIDALPDAIERTTKTVTRLTKGLDDAGDAATDVPAGLGDIDLGLGELDDLVGDLTKKFDGLFPGPVLTRAEQLEALIRDLKGAFDEILFSPGADLFADDLSQMNAMIAAARAELEAINLESAGGPSAELQAAGNVASDISNALTSGGASLLEMIPGVAGQIVGAVFAVGQQLAEEGGAEQMAAAFGETLGAFEAVLTEMGPLIEELGPVIVEGVLDIIKAIPEAIPKMMDGLLASIDEMLDEGFVGDILKALIKLIPAIIKAIARVFFTIYVEIPRLIARHIGDSIKEWASGMKEWGASVKEGIQGFGAALKEDWKGTLKDLFLGLRDVFLDWGIRIKEWLLSLLPEFVQEHIAEAETASQSWLETRRAAKGAGDLFSPPGTPGRFYVGPEGSFELSPNDTLLAMSGLKGREDLTSQSQEGTTIEVVLSADAERLGFGLDPFIEQGIRQGRIRGVLPGLRLRSPQTASGI